MSKREEILAKLQEGTRELCITCEDDEIAFIRDTGDTRVQSDTLTIGKWLGHFYPEEYRSLIDDGTLVPSNQFCSTYVLPGHPHSADQ